MGKVTDQVVHIDQVFLYGKLAMFAQYMANF